jgi:predicted metal-dependent peptidase
MTLSPERKLKKVVIDLMRDPTFADMSGIFMLGSKSVLDGIPTAATNGRDEVYGTAFVNKLDLKELAFVVVHEAYHKMLRHLTVWVKLYEEDPQLANMACDYVINLAIVKRDPNEKIVAVPKVDGKAIALLDKRFDNMNSKQVYDILKQEKESRKGNGPGPSGDGGNGETLDHHDWEGARELTEKEREQLVKDVDQAIRQGQITAQKLHGKGGGNLDRELSELLDPKVDWRELLRDFVTNICSGRDMSSWRKPNRRFLATDVIMPSMVSERIGCIAIGSDTSGSIGPRDHQRNLSETGAVLDLVKPETVHMIYWDGKVAGHEVYNAATSDEFVNSTKPKGGGGTDPSCMEKYLRQHGIKPECIIMFTDGYVPNWGNDWDGVPILWAICGGNKVIAPVGKTIHVED